MTLARKYEWARSELGIARQKPFVEQIIVEVGAHQAGRLLSARVR